ncbi:hypothetical protein HDV01_000338 [Terramyces sp. JEL0728]|nr:hypothetical protein HDV01_000338 [Terramyces sp. JEL0728]
MKVQASHSPEQDRARLFKDLKKMYQPIYKLLGTANKHDYDEKVYLEMKYQDPEAVNGDAPIDNFMSHFKLMYNLKTFDILEMLEIEKDSPQLNDLLKENTDREEWEKHRQELKEHLYSVPKWVDMESVQRGKKFFWLQLPFLLFSFLYISLHMHYFVPRINSTLTKTGYLLNPKVVLRRLYETTKFVMECMASKNSLAVNSSGWNTIVKVRCLHSSVRARLEARKTIDTSEAFVNQSDMGHTLAAFAFSILGLPMIGIKVSRQNLEDYFHLWRYIGYYIGVRDDINPLAQPIEDLLDHFLQFYAHSFKRENASPRLSKALNDSNPFGRTFSIASCWIMNPSVICEIFELEQSTVWSCMTVHLTLVFIWLFYLPVQILIYIFPSFAYTFGGFCLNVLSRVIKGDTNFNPVAIANQDNTITCPITGQVSSTETAVASCPITGKSGSCPNSKVTVNDGCQLRHNRRL